MVRRFIINITLLLIGLVGSSQNFLFNQHSGQTLNFPTVTTQAVTSIGTVGATLNGTVVSDGGGTITQRGFVYSISSSPDLNDEVEVVSGTTGSYNINIPDKFFPNQTYYVRAFATNNVGTVYGNQVSFTTLPLANIPTVTTDSIVATKPNEFRVYGNVTSDGGSAIIERGFVYNQIGNPTVNDTKIIAGGTTGSYNIIISNLQCGITYYVRAYAINSAGIAYGLQKQQTTESNQLPNADLVLYLDGNGLRYNITSYEAGVSAIIDIRDGSYQGSGGSTRRVEGLFIGAKVYDFNQCSLSTIFGWRIYYTGSNFQSYILNENVVFIRIESGLIQEIKYLNL